MPPVPKVPKPKAPSTGTPTSLKMGLNLPKTHRTASSAINLPKTQRVKWKKLG